MSIIVIECVIRKYGACRLTLSVHQELSPERQVGNEPELICLIGSHDVAIPVRDGRGMK